jgi:hypothetical protein
VIVVNLFDMQAQKKPQHDKVIHPKPPKQPRATDS